MSRCIYVNLKTWLRSRITSWAKSPSSTFRSSLIFYSGAWGGNMEHNPQHGLPPHNWNWNYKGRRRHHLLSLFNNQMCIRLFYIEVIKNPYILWKGLLYIGQNVNRMWPCALTGNTKKCKCILNLPGPKIIQFNQNGVCTLKKIDEQKLDSVNVESPVYSERTQV